MTNCEGQGPGIFSIALYTSSCS